MLPHRFIQFLVVMLFFLPVKAVVSQPISYPDLYKQLESKNYEEAEPVLRRYLKENKNNNPSALIFMGNIFYEKALEEMMGETDAAARPLLDSALYFYQAALDNLTGQSFKGKEKYYKAFLKSKSKRKITIENVQQDIGGRMDRIRKKLQKLNRSDARTDSILSVEVKRQGKYYALIIGISIYNNPKLNLDRPVKDAQKLKEILSTNYIFDNNRITLMANPTRQQILKELYDFRKRVNKKDNLLIFYAGHGYWDEEAKQGYWWPRDATPDDPTNWLSNGDLKEQIRGIKSSHTLVISDACFSGAIFKTRGVSDIRSAPTDMLVLNRQPSRRAMTSGTLTTVPDQSVFFEHLSKQLNENKEKYISSQFLFDNIRQRVISNSMIVPQDGVINDTGDEGGDFIFIRKN